MINVKNSFKIVLILFIFCSTLLSAKPIEFYEDSTITSPKSLPKGDNSYSAQQDSNYSNLVKARIPANVLVRNLLILSDKLWQIEKKFKSGSPLNEAIAGIKNMPREYSIPLPNELVQRQINIENAFYVPYANTYKQSGLKIPLGDIYQMLGLVEDVSPIIKYNLDYTAPVEVVIYSVKAIVVATLFDGVQSPGRYTLKWNGRDSNGKIMEPGDYVAEVRIGKDYYVRKRILIQY